MGRDTQMRGDGDRWGAGGPPMSRRVLLAAGGAVLLSSTAAALTADYDARAHSAGTQLRPAADGAAGRTSTPTGAPSSTLAGAPSSTPAGPPSGTLTGAPSRTGQASPATSRPTPHPELTPHAARPP